MRSFFLALLVAIPTFAAETTWFSEHPRELKALLSDPRESQMKVGYMYGGDRKSYLDLALGGHLGFYRRTDENTSFSVTPRAGIHSRFRFFSRSFDLQATDFFGGIAFSLRENKNAFEFLIAHSSSHLGDDLIRFDNQQPFNFSYELVRLLYSRDFDFPIRVYAGLETRYRSEPSSLKWKPTLILGGDLTPLDSSPSIYTAFDLRFQGYQDYSPDLSVSIGTELGNLKTTRKQRVFLEVFNGHSMLGQFYFERLFYLMAGLGFTL